MAIDHDKPETPGWWLNLLAGMLHDRRAGREGRRVFTRKSVASAQVRPPLTLLQDYLRGDPPLRDDIHADWAAPFRQYLRLGRMNVAPMLVSAPSNRMGIRDFRTAAAGDELGDTVARDLIKRNNLRMRAREVHDYMLGLGDGYTIVTPPDQTRAYSLITAESPMECITYEDPTTGETIAGLKMYRDELFGTDWAYLFLPGELWVARADVPSTTLFRKTFVLSDRWDWDTDKMDDVPGRRVAMVRFRNKDGRSEIEGHLNDLDRINDKLFNEWWIGKLQAHKQRALEMPDEDVEDDVVQEDGAAGSGDTAEMTDEEWAEIFTSAPDAMWRLPKGAKIWESSGYDGQALLNSIKAELQWLAATSHNPLHSITPDAAQGSAEGATLQREEHVYKIEDRRDRADGSWAKTLALAFEFQKDRERADVARIEAIWGPIERYSLAQKGSAVAQLKGSVPWEVLMTDVMQFSPGDVVDRLKPLRAQDLLYGTVAGQAGEPAAAPAAAAVPAAAAPGAPAGAGDGDA